MKNFISILILDYKQRTRSYAFLITLCISLAVAYWIIPSTETNYSTFRIGEYVGAYNASWIGYVSAMMTSLFLSLIGFYLINSAIKDDITNKIGQIIAATKISNLEYLLSKMLSNFFVLLTIAFVVFCMSILLFFLYNNGFSFDSMQFIKPFVIITIPSLFFISALAVVFEVLFIQKSILQGILFFSLLAGIHAGNSNASNYSYLDMSGTQIVTDKMEEIVKDISLNTSKEKLAIGYILGNTTKPKSFIFNGIDFPNNYILSRLAWVLLGLGLVVLSSFIFHRFRNKELPSIKKKKNILTTTTKNDVNLADLSKIPPSFKIGTLLLTEFILLIKNGPKWLWVLNGAGVISLCLIPITIAHQIILPILLFLQVGRWSSLVTKEKTFNIHFFTDTSYKPLARHFLSQILSGVLLAFLLSLPLIIRYLFLGDYISTISILLGGMIIVSFAIVLGLLSNRKKLFETLFFLITYTNINKMPLTDYFGGLHHSFNYLIGMTILILMTFAISYFIKSIRFKKA